MAMIPSMRPKLPSAERLAPYLQQIDSSRIYSNFGPLLLALEERLEAHFGLKRNAITIVANATLGLTLSLMAQKARPGSLCVMPAWTFVASAHAATMAGLVPYFVDVEADTWALDAEEIANAISQAPAEVGAVMPVAPFGQPIDIAAWDRFRSRTGLPVVIDAAAGFDSLKPGEVPAVVSLHATKIFGVGEGGFVASTDTSLKRSIRARSNFGFDGTREAIAAAANAKLSEYHAAVGLAALDEWDEVRAEWMMLAQAYRAALSVSNRMNFQDGFGERWVTSTCMLNLTDPAARRSETALQKAGIETRLWWGNGAHAHRATAAMPRTALPATEALARSTLGLPLYRGLTSAQIRDIADVVLLAARD